MQVRHGVLNARPGHRTDAQLHVSGPKPALASLPLKPAAAAATLAEHGLTTEGDLTALDRSPR